MALLPDKFPRTNVLQRTLPESWQRRPRRRALKLEALEARELLAATNLGEIHGTAFVDNNRNGLFSPGEAINGATVELYRDLNGNGSLDDADAALAVATANGRGEYRFQDLASGIYYVVQPTQKLGKTELSRQVSGAIRIQGAGVRGQVIDSFSTPSAATTDVYPGGSPTARAAFQAREALGGQRDVEAILKSGIAGDSVEIRSTEGLLFFNPDYNAIGTYVVQWDGEDSAADGLNAAGLGHIDLTEVNGVAGVGAGIELTGVEFDHPGGIVRFRVYTSATQWSEATLNSIPPFVTQDVFLPFDGAGKKMQFVAAGPEGGADFANVGAVELEIEATQQAMDGEFAAIGVIGRDVQVADFLNQAPVPGIDIEKLTNGNQADKASDPDVPQVPTGTAVTWTYLVTNNGGADLNDVVVNDDQVGIVTDIVGRSGGDTDNALEPGEVWTYQATSTAVEGAYANRGSVTAVSDIGERVSDADLSHYFGVTAKIDVEKATNGKDADVPDTGPEVLVGEPVTFTYVVRNLGNVVLSNVQVMDDNGTPAEATDDFFARFTGGDADNDELLDTDEVWMYDATRLATVGAYQNLGTVVARDPNGNEVRDSDPSNHRGVDPPPPIVPEVLSSLVSKRRFLTSYHRR